jgi:hypothetical protein
VVAGRDRLGSHLPLFTALTALCGLARWGMLASSVAYAAYCFYLIVAFRISA